MCLEPFLDRAGAEPANNVMDERDEDPRTAQ